MLVKSVPCLFVLALATAAAAADPLPNAAPLLFDHRRPALPRIHFTSYQGDPLITTAKDVTFTHFARTEIVLPIEPAGDARDLVLRVEVEKAPETPILLLHEKVFGGDQRIPFDTSNFCEWLTAGPPGEEFASSYVVVPLKEPKAYLRTSTSARTLLFYIGFASSEARNRRYDVTVEAEIIKRRPNAREQSCELLRGPQSIGGLHLSRKDLKSDVVIETRDLVIHDWHKVPQSTTPPISAVLTPSKVLSIAIDMPKYHYDSAQGVPALKIRGNTKGIALLAGPFAAQSAWELERLAPLSSEDEDVSLFSLGPTLSHLISNKSLFSPPGISLILLIFPTNPAEKSVTLSVQPFFITSDAKISRENGQAFLISDKPEHVPRHLVWIQRLQALSAFVRHVLFESLAFVGLIVVVRALSSLVMELMAKDQPSPSGPGPVSVSLSPLRPAPQASEERVAETTPLIMTD